MLTDLAITGKPAQFGRGVMQDVSDKLLGQFTDCLEQKVGRSRRPPPSRRRSRRPRPRPPAAATDSGSNGAGPEAQAHNVRDLGAQRSQAAAAAPAENDALDLGATVLPVLLKSYWRQALGVLVVLLVLRRLLRR